MIIWLVVLFIGMVVLGLWAGRGVRDLQSFALSRGYFGPIAIASTIVASGIGGGVVVGMAEKGYATGVGCAVCLLGFSLQLFWMGKLAPRFTQFGAPLTIGEILGAVYGKAARIVTGVLWVAFCGGFIAVQLSALGSLLTAYLPYSLPACAAIGAAVLLIYCSTGGIRAVVATDIMQVAVMLLVLPALAIFAVWKIGGWGVLFESVPKAHLNPLGHLTPLQFISVFLTFFIGDMFVPPMVQRVVMTPSVAMAKRSFIRASWIIIPFCLVGTLLGLCTYSVDGNLSPSGSIPYLLEVILPGGMSFLAVIGLMAATLSTADSYLHAASVAIVRDLLFPILRVKEDSMWGLLWVRLSTVGIGGVALILAAQGSGAIDLLLHTFSLWGPMMVVPIFALLYNRPLPKWAFFTSMGLAGVTLIVWAKLDLLDRFGIAGIMPAMAVTALFAVVVLWGRSSPVVTWRSSPEVAAAS